MERALVERLQSTGIAAAVLQDVEDMIEHDPQLAARGALVPFDHPLLGRFGHAPRAAPPRAVDHASAPQGLRCDALCADPLGRRGRHPLGCLSENEALTNRDPQTPDRDAGPGAHRLYELPGLTHGSGRACQGVSRAPQPGAACTLATTDVNMADYGLAALRNLARWVEQGVPPPSVPRLRVENGVGIQDADGNTLGVLRPAQLDAPPARYGAPPDGSACSVPRELGTPVIPMYRVPLDKARLARLYPGGKKQYLRRFDSLVDQLVAKRLLLVADGERKKVDSRRFADQAFIDAIRY